LPGQYADITRPARVKIRYLDEAGVRREMEADGLLAACLQHESDHLDGILFGDHLSPLKRNMIMRRLAKEQPLKQDERAREAMLGENHFGQCMIAPPRRGGLSFVVIGASRGQGTVANPR